MQPKFGAVFGLGLVQDFWCRPPYKTDLDYLPVSYTYIEPVMTSHVQKSNVSAHRVLGLLNLPHELLIHIFKSQTSFRDVSRLSQACSLLYTISHSNAYAIANAIVQQPSIPVQEATDLAHLQLTFDMYADDDSRLTHAHNVSLAARAIANSTSLRLLSYCYNEAFRLAEVELCLASSDAVQYNSTPSILEKGCLLESPVATAGFDAHIAGGIDYFGLRQCMFTNTQESVCALVMAATYFIPRTRRLDSKCTIHPLDALLPHEIARFFRVWYWFKLYVLSYHVWGDRLRQTLAAELKSMNSVQITAYFGIINFLFNGLEEEQARKFGIKEITVDLTNESYITGDWYEARKEWDDLRKNIIARQCELDTLIIDKQPMLEGCSDVCDGEGNCKPRGENKGIWEV